MMDWFHNILWHHEHFLGVKWGWWKLVGWTGTMVFFSRFLVQWYATERKKQVVVPTAFWWLSLAGTLLLFSYALFSTHDSVFILCYAFSWIPYLRNLVIHHRHVAAHLNCPGCGSECPPTASFCAACGTRLPAREKPPGR